MGGPLHGWWGGVQKRKSHCLVCRALCKLHTHTDKRPSIFDKDVEANLGPNLCAPSQTPCICHTWPGLAALTGRLLCLLDRVTHTEDVVGQHHLAGPISLAALHCTPSQPISALCLAWVFSCFAARLSDRRSPSSGGLGFQTGDSICVLPQAPGPCCPPELAQPHHQTSSSAVAQSTWPAELRAADADNLEPLEPLHPGTAS